MVGWIHFVFQTAALVSAAVSLIVVRPRGAQREALRALPPGAPEWRGFSYSGVVDGSAELCTPSEYGDRFSNKEGGSRPWN